ncbi:MAG TPA: hypothetical protein VK034_25430 [Enhygromyxa sp.]|nr:hypothetical protein [Enhygromyxa sp.]
MPEQEPAANIEGSPQRERERMNEPVSSERRELEESEFEDTDLDDEQDIEQMAVRILSRARQRIREQPLTAAAGAFIIGFAFGNGVPKFLARAGVAIGLRMVMQRMYDRAEMFEADA